MQRPFFLASILAMIASPAFAHTGVGTVSGFSAGFGHPIGGLDHVLAMVAVGILAAQQGGKSLWTVPAAFVGMMLIGGMVGIAGISMPFVEIGIVGSIVVLGGVIAFGRQLPMGVAMALVGVLAIFHGHAHGTEMPADTSGVQYAIGFILATALLHAAGIGLGVGAQKVAEKIAPMLVRVSGGAIAAGGALLFIA
ncbi:HupE/UreJ family protein [Rhodospirillaceae bacterium KN72]|uniref:HupE/UreJ family protein n=1 Tax=Pacificispira spongiicola TaxID=2729598 RepID=A0A7Y0DZ98_9PROT|nr:HupE/UreJ family protein [Pacificispira spongiicola]NMM44337.1 HupE/UreJ family protein [Pacificispira spongiicola]